MVEEAPPRNEGSNGVRKAIVGVVVVVAVRLCVVVVVVAIVLCVASTALPEARLVGMAKLQKPPPRCPAVAMPTTKPDD